MLQIVKQYSNSSMAIHICIKDDLGDTFIRHLEEVMRMEALWE